MTDTDPAGRELSEETKARIALMIATSAALRVAGKGIAFVTTADNCDPDAMHTIYCGGVMEIAGL